MASIAICPHCYLQLVVPDGVEPDERVECPTCAKAFGLDEAVLRAIPEVVRRSSSTGHSSPASFAAAASDATEAEESLVDAQEPSTNHDDTPELDAEEVEVVEQIKARVEEEIASGNLLPGMSGSLSLETPAGLEEPEAEETAAQDDDAIDQWHRPTVRLNDLTQLDDETAEQPSDESADDPIREESFDEFSARADAEASAEIDEAEVVAKIDDEVQAADEYNKADERVEESVARPSATTLADLMPPDEEPSEEKLVDEELGPSFELPNVPLTPSSATVEYDPNESFGPAGGSDFELDHLDFDSTPVEESAAYEPEAETYEEPSHDEVADEVAEDDEPVFSEPAAASLPSTPFVLPNIPHRRRKRSVVRLLVGTALGGLVGITLGYAVLLYVLGPEGDILEVAQYIPSSVLPASFHNDAAPAAARTAANPIVPPVETTPPAETPSTELAADDSATMPATYTEESATEESAEIEQPESSTLPDVLADDDRYGGEPSPLDEPAAEPISESTPAVAPPVEAPSALPLFGETYTVNDLATALETGEAALKGLVAGDLSDAAVRRTKGMSYAKLCDLAEALTFVDRTQPSVESEQAIDSTVRLFRDALSDPHTRDEVNRIATIWIDSPHRQHGGVFLAGAVSGGEIAGDVYEYTLATGDGGPLTLLAAEPLDSFATGSQRPVGIVGSIVDNPTGDVTGYHGTAKRAIWVARAIPLE